MKRPERTSTVGETIDRAMQKARQEIGALILAQMPPETGLGELLRAMTEAGHADLFESLTLGQVAAIVRGEAVRPARPRAERAPAPAPAAADAPEEAPPAAPAARPKRRAPAVREAGPVEIAPPVSVSDMTLLACIAAAGGSARAELLRKETGGDSAAIRDSLQRLAAEGRLRIEGQRRGTTYFLPDQSGWSASGALREEPEDLPADADEPSSPQAPAADAGV